MTYSNDLHLPSNEDGRRSFTPASADNRALPPRRLNTGKRGKELDDTISSIGKRLNETRKEDNHDAFGRNIAHKLRNVRNDQRIFLEKIINDAVFEAELGNLNRNCYLRISDPTTSNITVFNPLTSLKKNTKFNRNLVVTNINLSTTYSVKYLTK